MFMVNVGKYTIHGSYGKWWPRTSRRTKERTKQHWDHIRFVGPAGLQVFLKKHVSNQLREIPGTPRNGTPFWEASHTIPIPLP